MIPSSFLFHHRWSHSDSDFYNYIQIFLLNDEMFSHSPGAPIREYVGVLRTEQVDVLLQNNFIFVIDCLETMKGLDDGRY